MTPKQLLAEARRAAAAMSRVLKAHDEACACKGALVLAGQFDCPARSVLIDAWHGVFAWQLALEWVLGVPGAWLPTEAAMDYPGSDFESRRQKRAA